MSTFRLYLWKEWREQRGALLALGAALPVLVAVIGLQLSRSRTASASFVFLVAALACVLALVVVVGELLALERERTGPWIERLPRGFGPAFCAKLVTFFATSVAALAYGTLVGSALALLRARDAAEVFRLDWMPSAQVLPVLVVLLVAPWIFAASAWCRRGMLAFAAGTLLALGGGLPLFAHEAAGYRATAPELVLGAMLFLSGAFVSAWLGFRAQRLGRGLARVVWSGGGTAALMLAPLWGWALVQLDARNRVDLTSPACSHQQVWVSMDGNVAVIEACVWGSRWKEPPRRTLWIDLVTRRIRDLGLNDVGLDRVSRLGAADSQPLPTLIVTGNDGSKTFDARNGQPSSDVLESDTTFAWPAGLGWTSYEPAAREVRFRDPFSNRTLLRRELLPGDVWIGPQAWLVHSFGVWHAFDPRRDELTLIPWIDPGLTPLAMDRHGRLVLREEEQLFVADLRDGSVKPVLGPTLERPPEPVEDDLGQDGEILVRSWPRTYRLDLECLELVPLDLGVDGQLQRRLADGTLVVWTAAGFEWRGPEGDLRKTVRFDELERSEEVTP